MSPSMNPEHVLGGDLAMLHELLAELPGRLVSRTDVGSGLSLTDVGSGLSGPIRREQIDGHGRNEGHSLVPRPVRACPPLQSGC
jgi:hypothetical protein